MTPYIYNKVTGEYIPYVEIEAGPSSQNLREETVDEFKERVGWVGREDEVLLDADTQVFDVPSGEVRWRVPAPPTPAKQMDLDALSESVSTLSEQVAAQAERIAELEARVEELEGPHGWEVEHGPPVDKAPEGPPIDNSGDREGKPPIEWEVEHGKAAEGQDGGSSPNAEEREEEKR